MKGRKRRGPYLENLKFEDSLGQRRRHLLLLSGVVEKLHALLAFRPHPFAQRLFFELEGALIGSGRPCDGILDNPILYTDFDNLTKMKQSGLFSSFRHRLAITSHVTARGNLSVCFEPVYFGENGKWVPAPEWNIPYLGEAGIMERPNNELLFLHDIDWLLTGPSRWEGDRDVFDAACVAVHAVLAVVLRRVERRFDLQFDSYPALVVTDPFSGPCIGLEIVDAAEEYLHELAEFLIDCDRLTGYRPGAFWAACQSAMDEKRNWPEKASRTLRGTSSPSSTLTPSVVARYHDRLKEAKDYGMWRPQSPIAEPSGRAPAQTAAKQRPPGQTAGRGSEPPVRHPFPHPRPEAARPDPTGAPDYSALPRYQASKDELASAGTPSVDALVEEVNRLAAEKGQWPVTQSDFPSRKAEFTRLLKRRDYLRGL